MFGIKDILPQLDEFLKDRDFCSLSMTCKAIQFRLTESMKRRYNTRLTSYIIRIANKFDSSTLHEYLTIDLRDMFGYLCSSYPESLIKSLTPICQGNPILNAGYQYSRDIEKIHSLYCISSSHLPITITKDNKKFISICESSPNELLVKFINQENSSLLPMSLISHSSKDLFYHHLLNLSSYHKVNVDNVIFDDSHNCYFVKPESLISFIVSMKCNLEQFWLKHYEFDYLIASGSTINLHGVKVTMYMDKGSISKACFEVPHNPTDLVLGTSVFSDLVRTGKYYFTSIKPDWIYFVNMVLSIESYWRPKDNVQSVPP